LIVLCHPRAPLSLTLLLSLPPPLHSSSPSTRPLHPPHSPPPRRSSDLPQQRVGHPAGARSRRQAGMGIHGLVPESGDGEEAEVSELRLQLVDETGSSPLAHERQQVVVYRLRIDVVEIWDILPVTAQRAVLVEILPEGIHLGHDHSKWGRY